MVSQPPISINTDMGEISSKKAVIWDMDGVIADTGSYHLKGWQIVLQKTGKHYTEEEYRRNTGRRSDSILRDILGEKATQEEIAKITQEKERIFKQLISQNIRPFPGVLKLITSLKEHGFKTAIASSAPMGSIQLITRSLNIHKCFDIMLSGWDLTKSKPDPEIFLQAVEKLGVKAKDCIVIEDAIAGVTASKRAGICCIAVTNTNPREALKEADLVINSLEEITIDDLEKLLGQHK